MVLKLAQPLLSFDGCVQEGKNYSKGIYFSRVEIEEERLLLAKQLDKIRIGIDYLESIGNNPIKGEKFFEDLRNEIKVLVVLLRESVKK